VDEDAKYLLTNLDSGDQQSRTGRELLKGGLPVTIADQPGVATVTYRRQP
jgi:hypothetical protein